MIETLSTLLAPHGLCPRGAFHPADGSAGTLVLVGWRGPVLWPAFAADRRDEPHPLDAWTRRVVEPIATKVGAQALYPFEGPPWHPFQTWAMAAEGLRPSPVGVLMHPEAGLWHAYRAALAFPDVLPVPEVPAPGHPCDTCTDTPCLSACPVTALAPGTYDVPACAAEVRGTDRGACRPMGCAARRACPVAAERRYPEDQLTFHMNAFLDALP